MISGHAGSFDSTASHATDTRLASCIVPLGELMKTHSLRWLVACSFALIVVGCGGVAPTDQTPLAPTGTMAISYASLDEECEEDICNPGCSLADPCLCDGICDDPDEDGGGGGGGICSGDPCDSACVAANPCLCYADSCGGSDGPSSEASCSAEDCGGSVAMVQVCSYPSTAWVDCSTCTGGCN